MTGNVTDFGKFLRKLRIDHGTTLRKMATALGVSSGYLSAIELGKRSVPIDLPMKIQDEYHLDAESYEAMKMKADMQIDSVNVGLETANDQQKEVFLAFARKFDDLDEESLNGLYEILKNK